MIKPVVIVAGFGRCGSSLVMQMLQAGGLECLGEYPSFEMTEANPFWRGSVGRQWMEGNRGKAVKVLDPQLQGLPAGIGYLPIWLDRNSDQQAKSLAKFASMVMRIPMDRAAVRKFENSIRKDRSRAIQSLKAQPLFVKFEDLITWPRTTAASIAEHCRPIADLDIDRMAAVVRPRSTDCAPDMSMELTLIREYELA